MIKILKNVEMRKKISRDQFQSGIIFIKPSPGCWKMKKFETNQTSLESIESDLSLNQKTLADFSLMSWGFSPILMNFSLKVNSTLGNVLVPSWSFDVTNTLLCWMLPLRLSRFDETTVSSRFTGGCKVSLLLFLLTFTSTPRTSKNILIR